MSLAAGAKLGPYEIVVPIGAGGMGEVYRARDPRLGRDVAIKVSGERFSKRFEREARAISALNHPHICTVHDVGPNYLVMELVEGETLSARLRKGALPMEQVLRYGVEIADALAAAHAQGVTHHDLKPANIMVTKSGIKVLDFGLAKMARSPNTLETETLTAPRAVMGTLAYMAPEQLEGKACDARSDIFSFGLVLYEMTAGKRAFNGDSQAALLADVMRCEPAPLQSAPEKLEHTIRRCLAKDSENRWQTARDLQGELEWAAMCDSLPHRELVPRGAILPWIACVLAMTAGIGWWIAWRSTRPVDHALLRLSVNLGADAVPGLSITAAISPDGTRLVFPVRGPDGTLQLATRLLDQPQATLLSGTEDGAAPFFSPNGEWIGFFAERKMKKVSVRGGAVITLCDAPDGRGGAWGEDDNIIATLNSESATGLSRIPAAGGTPQELTHPGQKGEATHRWPQILPGGQAVLFMGSTTASNYDDASIEVLSLKTGQVKTVQPGGYFGRYLPGGYLVYVHQGTLFGVGFDLERLAVRGLPAVLQQDVAGNQSNGGGQFDFSRNGTFVYLSGKASSGTWMLAWLDSTGKTQPLLNTPGIYYNPRLSPDGKRLAFSTNSAIEVYDSGRDSTTQLTFTAQTKANLRPVWTPDGKHVIFQSQGSTNFALQWTRADGSGEAQQLLEGNYEVVPRSVSPDGKHLAFEQRNAEHGLDLWTLPLDLSDPERPKPGKPELFLHTPFSELGPAFSPDGRWIAYESAESGRGEVYVRPFPAGGPSGSGKWLISAGGGQSPIWSRDTAELFYKSSDNRIMTASYTASGGTFAPAKPRPWAKTQILGELEAAPDGKRFVVQGLPERDSAGEPRGSVHVTFLLNFFDEVRRRIPTK